MVNWLFNWYGSSQLPVASATNLTNIPAGQLTGTVPDGTLDTSSVTKQGNAFNGINQLVQLNGSCNFR